MKRRRRTGWRAAAERLSAVGIKENVGLVLLRGVLVDIGVQPADVKAIIQVEQARAGIVVLPLRVEAAVVLRDRGLL